MMAAGYLSKRSYFSLQFQKGFFLYCFKNSQFGLGYCSNSHLNFDRSKNPVPLKLHYDFFNPPGSTHKSPTVILHGFLGSKSHWKSMGKAIAEKSNRKVYVLDSRNHGDSPHSDTHEYFSMAADVERFLVDHGIQKCVFLGHSMGGRTAMVLALQKKALVEKLVIVEQTPLMAETDIVIALRSSLLQLLGLMRKSVQGISTEKESLTEVRRSVDHSLAQDIKSISLRKFVLENLTEQVTNGRSSFGWRLNLDALENSLRDRKLIFPSSLEGSVYSGPTLFIFGAESNHLSLEECTEVRKYFPLCQIEYIEGANHSVHEKKPTEFLERLLPFL